MHEKIFVCVSAHVEIEIFVDVIRIVSRYAWRKSRCSDFSEFWLYVKRDLVLKIYLNRINVRKFTSKTKTNDFSPAIFRVVIIINVG